MIEFVLFMGAALLLSIVLEPFFKWNERKAREWGERMRRRIEKGKGAKHD